MNVTIIPARPALSPAAHILALADDLDKHQTMAALADRLGMTDLAEEITAQADIIADEITVLTGTDPRFTVDEEV